MFTKKTRLIWIVLSLIAGLVISCSPRTMPPGANTIYGGVEEARFSYHYWQEGLAILFWHDFVRGEEGCTGSGSTEDPVFRLECDVESGDGRSFGWKVHTQDGITADMWINDQRYDLAQGNMFLVSTGEGGLQVEQLQRDFSTLEPSNDAVSALVINDPDVASFIAGIKAESDSPEVEDEYGLVEFTDALRLAGQSVEFGDPVNQPFFSAPGQVVVVNGEDVQVFEYPDSAAAAAEAAQISPNASSVGTTMVTWVASPHFYSMDRLIALYVGDDQVVVNALTTELGQPIAEGQGMPQLPPPDAATLLADAFATADYEALQALMGEAFVIGYWRSEGQTLTPAQAIEQLRLNLLPDPSAVSFIRDRNQFPDLGNVDPGAIFGPDVQIVELIYSQGWGIDGSDEAILAIAQNADGSQYWHGMLSGRFGQVPAPAAQEPASDETAVYRNSENGFELDYPASWHLDEQVLGSRASGALFYAAETNEEPVFSAVIFLWDPRNDLDAWVDQRRQSWPGSNAAVLSEEELTVADGQRAVKFELLWLGGQMTNHLFMEIGDRYLELFSPGDPATFDEIIGSLRFVESDS